MNYPYKDDADLAAIKRLAGSAYAEDDKPFLNTQRYSLNPDYETTDVIAKRRLDMQGALENHWWLKHWKENVNK